MRLVRSLVRGLVRGTGKTRAADESAVYFGYEVGMRSESQFACGLRQFGRIACYKGPTERRLDAGQSTNRYLLRAYLTQDYTTGVARGK